MAFVDMKLPKEKKSDEIEAVPYEDRDRYPYGLTIDLHDKAITKLGIDVSKVDVGSTVIVMAKCKVTSVSQREMQGEKKNDSLDLQITHLDVGDIGKGNKVEKVSRRMGEIGGVE